MRLAPDILLMVAVAGSWLAVAGLLLSRNAYDGLHAVGYAGIVCGWSTAAALFWMQPFSAALAAKAVILAVFLTISGAVLIHSIARAILLREESGDRI